MLKNKVLLLSLVLFVQVAYPIQKNKFIIGTGGLALTWSYLIGWKCLTGSYERAVEQAVSACVPLAILALQKMPDPSQARDLSQEQIITLLAAELDFNFKISSQYDSWLDSNNCIKLLQELTKSRCILNHESFCREHHQTIPPASRRDIDQVIAQALSSMQSTNDSQKNLNLTPDVRRNHSDELLQALRLMKRKKNQLRWWLWSPLWLPGAAGLTFFVGIFVGNGLLNVYNKPSVLENPSELLKAFNHI